MSKILNIHAKSGPVSLHGAAAAAAGRHKKAALHIHTVTAGTCGDVQVDSILTKRYFTVFNYLNPYSFRIFLNFTAKNI